MMDMAKIMGLIEEAHSQATALELLAMEGDISSMTEARKPLKALSDATNALLSEFQSTKVDGMTVADIKAALDGYADNIQPQIYIDFNSGSGYCMIKQITDLTGTSPT